MDGLDPGAGMEHSARNFTHFFQRWGARANLRSVLNFVFPVALVDRFRGDDEGSLFALYAEAHTFVGQHPAIVMGSINPDVDLEILGFQAWYGWMDWPTVGVTWNSFFHMFSPIAPYNPVASNWPVGTWIPGLITNRPFTRTYSFAIGGCNPNMPAYAGWPGYVLGHQTRTTVAADRNKWFPIADQGGSWDFELPIRVPNGDSIAWQIENPWWGNYMRLAVSVLYRERVSYS